jgi:transcriptional regulator with XRE-family HTH domain
MANEMERSATMTQIGERLREARRQRRETLRQVSARCGLSISYISEVERGWNSTVDVLRRLAVAYDLELVVSFAQAVPVVPPAHGGVKSYA